MTQYIDVFNGDADGICALHQLRLWKPRPGARLVTGVKRDIHLLAQLKEVRAADITVLDISLDKNRTSVDSLLGGNKIFYVDHHYAGHIPEHSNFTVHIDPDPEICTALIVDRLLDGIHRPWAIVGAFGDNLHEAARKAALTLGHTEERIDKLRQIGELLNYNGYGKTPADLFYPPDELYLEVSEYPDPFDFFQRSAMLETLRRGFADDMDRAARTTPYAETDAGRVYMMDDVAWCRRVSGVFSNKIAREKPEKAHALLIDNGDGTYMVSVRAPLANRKNADVLCRAFPTGGGRAAAAGINSLPEVLVDEFLEKFAEIFA